MKRFVRWILRALMALVLLLAIVAMAGFAGVDRRAWNETPAGMAATGRLDELRKTSVPEAGPIRAGFGRAKLTPTLGAAQDDPETGQFRSLPLAGYGNRKGRPADGVHDDVWVKAIAFVSGSRTGVVVCADALIVPREVTDLAMKRIGSDLGLARGSVYFAATHTHCSLGGWGEGFVGEAFAGGFQPGVRVWFARQLAEAAKAALADLSPASVGSDAFPAPQFIRNRLVGDRGQVDPEFALLVVKQADGDTAVLGSFGAHATILGGGTMQFSAEYPGAWQRAVEKATGGMAMFAAGGVGSHSPKPPQGGFAGVDAMGQSLADEVLRRLPAIPLTNVIRFAMLSATLPLPELQTRITDDVRLRPWVAARLLPVGSETTLQGFRFGDALWFSTPCDFSGELALELKSEARALGLRAQVTSFNGDYVGYVIPAKYYHLDGYEPRTMSFYGPQLPDYFMATLRQLMSSLAK